ncbi:MAG: DUF4340 domain-containing protein [Aestuariibacter sp.]
MNKQNLILLSVAVVIILGVLITGDEQRTTEFEKQKLFPSLLEYLPEVSNVKIADQSGLLFEGEKTEEGWLAKHKNDYPVATEDVVAMLNTLAKANLDEAKTRKPENFARLGVADLSDDDSEAVQVTISHAEQSWSLLVGNNASSGAGTYIRIPGEEQSWLTKTDISLPASQSDWLRDDILDIATSDVAKVARVDSESWQIVAQQLPTDEETDPQYDPEMLWQLVNMPEQRELKYSGILQGFVEDFIGLSFSDLHESLPEGTESQAKFVVTLSNEQLLEAEVRKVKDQYYISFNSEGLDSYWESWHYQLTSYAGGQLLKSFEDFLQALPEEESADSDATETDEP